MEKRILLMVLLPLLLAAVFVACKAQKIEGCYSSCGSISNISFPFRLKDDPRNCGYPEYQLSCESNRTVLYLHPKKFWVEAIEYKNQSILVVDSSLQNDCSSIPCNSLSIDDINNKGTYDTYGPPSRILDINSSRIYEYDYTTENTVFVNCSSQMDNDDSDSYIATTSCFNTTSGAYIYVLGRSMMVSELHPSCKIIGNALGMPKNERIGESNYREIHDRLMKGFQLFWGKFLASRHCPKGVCYSFEWIKEPGGVPYVACNSCYSSCDKFNESWHCFITGMLDFITGMLDYFAESHVVELLRFRFPGFFNTISKIQITYQYLIYFCMLLLVSLAGRTSIGVVCLIALLVYKLRWRHIWMDNTVEEFLSKYRCQTPARYSYWDIRRMTMRFKEKLGQGGFGSVYKGKLRNGPPVAIKMLSGKSKGNGQEFINEVATIGRIHHVNVVRLIGFCAEGSKRALIYEYMPNGSLEKYIYSHEGKSSPLSWEKMYQIALGIARGIEYLHQGCDMKILHFDIKPHNILLDDNFNPKVADFGLAKFYPTDESHLSVTAVGGTLGYMAPELFYKNTCRQVSYKSDVYSFGMLLMEMAGRRKNVNPSANSSQIYFPLWVYDKLDQDGEMGMEDAAEDEKEIAKKMVIVALWCIQMKPANRPSMSKVIEMLEGSVELLQMPAKPFHSSPQRVPDEDHATDTNPTESSSIEELGLLSENYEESNNLDVIID